MTDQVAPRLGLPIVLDLRNHRFVGHIVQAQYLLTALRRNAHYSQDIIAARNDVLFSMWMKCAIRAPHAEQFAKTRQDLGAQRVWILQVKFQFMRPSF